MKEQKEYKDKDSYNNAEISGDNKYIYYRKKEGDRWAIIAKKYMDKKIIGYDYNVDLYQADSMMSALDGAATSGLFEPYQAFPISSWPEAVAIGDVNNDGRNDVVMTTSSYNDPENDYQIFVFLQNDSGALDPPVKYPAGNGESIDIGDVNNDGRNDVVVTADNSIGVFYHNRKGFLDPMKTFASNHSSFTNTHKVRIGDFNNDGRLDVAAIDWGTQADDVDIFFQKVNKKLDNPVTYYVEHGGYDDLEVGDVNNDGRQDIIVMSGQSFLPNVGVLPQESNGTFGLPEYYYVGDNILTHGVAAGDINNDGLNDIVLSYGGNRPYSNIGVLAQNSSGGLDPAISYQAYDIPEPVEIADVNLDGLNDVIVAHGGWNTLSVFVQNTDGTLLPYDTYTLPYASHYNPHGLAVGDINQDGADDVVIADYNNGLVVLYHTPPGQ